MMLRLLPEVVRHARSFQTSAHRSIPHDEHPATSLNIHIDGEIFADLHRYAPGLGEYFQENWNAGSPAIRFSSLLI
jgi:hypothetical protein